MFCPLRRSNIFTPSRKAAIAALSSFDASSSSAVPSGASVSHVGSGRTIPLRQGYLHKRCPRGAAPGASKRKKKYVALGGDGRLVYHPNLHDYMDDANGKEIPLQYVTVKVPGRDRPRGSRSVISLGQGQGQGQEVREDSTPVKKRLSGGGGGEDGGQFEFQIVSLDNKRWMFEAASSEDRDSWVEDIEAQILSSLQGNENSRSRNDARTAEALKRIRTQVPGNAACVDCDANNPSWASLNLGALMCIECSGIHRQLGSHVSRVRSVDLDEWPPGHLAVMAALGNRMANSVWEADMTKLGIIRKPTARSTPEEKERFIKAKYLDKKFLASAAGTSSLTEAVRKSDFRSVLDILARSNPREAPEAEGTASPLQAAAAGSDLAMAQLLVWANAKMDAGCLRLARAAGSRCGGDLVANLLSSSGCPDDDDGPGGGSGGTSNAKEQTN